MTGSHDRRTSRTGRRAAPAPPGMLGPGHLAALTGLTHPAPRHPVHDADMPDHPCPVPADAVASIHAAAVHVLTAVGQQDVLRCDLLVGVALAAERGRGVSLAPELAKALWRFCDAFADHDRRLAAAARGLRVEVR